MSAAIRFTRCVVPERGRPATMIGARSERQDLGMAARAGPRRAGGSRGARTQCAKRPRRPSAFKLASSSTACSQTRRRGAEVVGAEVVEAGLAPRRRQHRVLAERRPGASPRRRSRALRVAENGAREVGDADAAGLMRSSAAPLERRIWASSQRVSQKLTLAARSVAVRRQARVDRARDAPAPRRARPRRDAAPRPARTRPWPSAARATASGPPASATSRRCTLPGGTA